MAQVRKDKVQIEIEINGEPVKRTLADMEKSYKKLRAEIKHLEEGSDEFNKKAQQIKKLEEELNKTRKAARGLADEQDSLWKKGSAGAAKMAGDYSKLPGIFGKVATGISSALGPIGLIITAIAGVIKAAIGLASVTEEFQNMREEVNRFTGLTGDALSEVNAHIIATSRTFDQDMNEVLLAGSANAKVFESSMTETLDLIDKGLIATGKQGDEFLQQIKEYGPALKQAGLDQEEAYAVIASSIVDGAFQDKIPDAIKEFNIRIKDLSKGQQEVLEQTLGAGFTEKIVTGIKTGEKTSIEAINEIAGKMGELGADSSETQAIVSNLFGGPGEDVGADFIIGLQNVKGSMDELIDTSNVYIQRQVEQLGLEKELSKAQEELSMELDGVGNFFSKTFKQIKVFVFQGIAVAARYVKNLGSNFRIFRVQTVEAFNVVLGGISNFVNNIISAVNAVGKLIGIGGDLEKVNWEIDVEVSSEDLKKQLQDNIAKEREAFAEAQQVKAMEDAKKQEEMTRLTRLRERKKTFDNEKNLTSTELQKQAEIHAKAEQEINKLKIELMQEGTAKQLAQLRLQTDQRKAALKGSVEQITEQQQLLEVQHIQRVAQIKDQAARNDIQKIQADAQQRISLLKGTSEEIQAEQVVIEKQTTEKVKAVFSKNVEEQIELLKKQNLTEKEIIDETSRIKVEAEKQQVIAIREIKKTFATSTEQQYNAELKTLEKFHAEQQLLVTQAAIKRLAAGEDEQKVQEDTKAELLKLEEQFLADKKLLQDQFSIDSLATQDEIEKMKLQAALNRIQQEQEAEKKALQEKRKSVESTLGNVSNLIGQVSELNQAALDADLSKIEANKARELKVAGNNEAAKRNIEAKYAKQKEEAEKRSARRQKVISIAQTIISTAQAIAKTGAQMGYPAAIPFQVIAGAIGAAQIAAIRAQAFEAGGHTANVVTDGSNYFYQGQALQQTGTFAGGGHVSRGSIGVIGEKGPEWVAPNWMLKSQKYAPIFSQLESIRVRGYAVGGQTTPADTAVDVQQASISNQAIVEELRLLREQMPKVKHVTVWGEKEAMMNAEIYAAWQDRSSTNGV